jgi:predicted DNA-binding protein
MVQRARSGRQLAIELPPELLQRLKAHAAASDRPVSALVRRWIEAGLNRALEADAPAFDGTDLAQRVQALEAAVAALQKQAAIPRSTRPTKPSPPPASEPLELELDLGSSKPNPSAKGSTIPQMGDAPEGGITTAALAEALGMKRGSLNERLRRMGGAREGLELDGWRCCGQVAPLSGGPPRWVWEPA